MSHRHGPACDRLQRREERESSSRSVVNDHTRSCKRLGCDSCHLPELRTGDSDVAGLSDQLIRPYTDLLLHDMGATARTLEGMARA